MEKATHNHTTSSLLTVIEAHWNKIYNRAYSLLKNHEDAEEITQDTFIRAQQAWGQFRGEAAIGSWLYRIVTNLAYNRHQSRKSRGHKRVVSIEGNNDSSNTDSPAWNLLSDNGMNPSEYFLTDELIHGVMHAVDALSAAQREILLMRGTEQMTYSEIASKLGLSISAVKSRLARARDMLRNIIAQPQAAYAVA